ncbi:MAG: helix-turn-helix domain-containing protein [Chitinispirillales bacterium]|jgi:ribosome-binding protein aMBF1 (putative translation factor)|nr:helix-turn-helix domain-containing protein [Chitinispirillales bacterium]
MTKKPISPVGRNWDDAIRGVFTHEEIAASKLRVAMMIQFAKARNEQGITQKKLEAMSGVKQPIIARMESGSTSPRLDTVLKVLAPLGKTLGIVDLPQKRTRRVRKPIAT